MSTSQNDPLSGKNGRNASKANSPSTPPAASYRSRMSLEKKLGITFIGALLTVFFVVLGVRLMNVDSNEEKVEINLSSETEETIQAAKSTDTSFGAKPTPHVLADQSAPPMTPFHNSVPPQMKSPPTAYMPPAPATTAPATMNATTSPSPAAFASPSNATGNRYSTSNTAASNVSAASSTSPFTAGTSTDASLSNSGNPLRSAGSTTTMMTTAAVPTSTTMSTPATTLTAVGSSPYATPADRYATPTAATTTSPPTTAPPTSYSGNSYPASPYATPATTEPRPIAGAATSASPMTRTPGVAALGAATASTPMPYASTPSTMSPPVAAPITSTPPTVAAAPQAKPYVVAPGDSFWSIAQQAYGDGSYYRALFAYNSDRYPHAEDVRTGSVLDVPSVEVLKSKFPELCTGGAATVAAGGESPAMTGRANVAVAARTYIVQEGDTLFDIARRQLGKASYWSEIYNLNRAVLGENLEQLKPGTELMLPATQ